MYRYEAARPPQAHYEHHHHSTSPAPPGFNMGGVDSDGHRENHGGGNGHYAEAYAYGDSSGMPPDISTVPHHLQHDNGYEQGYGAGDGSMHAPGSGGGGPVGFGAGGGASPPGMGYGGGGGGGFSGGMANMSPQVGHGGHHDYMGHEQRMQGGQMQPMDPGGVFMQPDFSGYGGGAPGMDSPFVPQHHLGGEGPNATGAEFLLPRWSFNEASASATALIHPAITGWLIGPKGAAIGRLKESTGCRMWVNTARQTLSIRGDSLTELYAAVRAVESYVKSSPVYVDNDVGAMPGEQVRETTVACPPELLDAMQCHVRSIKRQSGAHTTFVNRKLAAIVITGPNSSVAAAVRHVHQVLARAKLARDEQGVLASSPVVHHANVTPPIAWEVGSAFETVSSCGSDAGDGHMAAAGGVGKPLHSHARAWAGMDPTRGPRVAAVPLGERPPRSPARSPASTAAAATAVESWQQHQLVTTQQHHQQQQHQHPAPPPGYGGGGGTASRAGSGRGGGSSVGDVSPQDVNVHDGEAAQLRAAAAAAAAAGGEDMSQLLHLSKPALGREHSCATRLLMAADNADDARTGDGSGGGGRDGGSGGRGGNGGTAAAANFLRASDLTATRSDSAIRVPGSNAGGGSGGGGGANGAFRGRELEPSGGVVGGSSGAERAERRSRSSPPALAEWDFSIDVSDAVGPSQSLSLSASPIPSGGPPLRAVGPVTHGVGVAGIVEGVGSMGIGDGIGDGKGSSSVSGASTPPSGSRSPNRDLQMPQNRRQLSSGRWEGAHARAMTLLDGDDDAASDVSAVEDVGGGGGRGAGGPLLATDARQWHPQDHQSPLGLPPDIGSPVGSSGSGTSRASRISGASNVSAASVVSVSALPQGFQAETVPELLSALRLEKWEEVLATAEVDLAALRLMSDADLAELGLPKGPRVKLIHAQRRGEI